MKQFMVMIGKGLAATLLAMMTAAILVGCPAGDGGYDGGDGIDPARKRAAPPEPEAQAGTPGQTPRSVCAACHEGEHKYWAYGKHSTLSCTDCHGEPGEHVVEKIDPRPGIKTPGRELCIECHDLAGDGSGKQLSVDERLEKHMAFLDSKHVIKIDRDKIKGRCLHCHDPHLGR